MTKNKRVRAILAQDTEPGAFCRIDRGKAVIDEERLSQGGILCRPYPERSPVPAGENAEFQTDGAIKDNRGERIELAKGYILARQP